MTIKIHPVRWWRDDATRYQSRPPYVAPPVESITFEPLPPPDPAFVAKLARIHSREAMIAALGIPLELLVHNPNEVKR